MEKYKELIASTVEKNRQKYIDHLLKLVSIDTHDIGHGIEGGLEGSQTGVFSLCV